MYTILNDFRNDEFFSMNFQRQCLKKICTNFSTEKVCAKDISNEFQTF